MNYSVVFYFDDETENKITSLIHLIVDNGVNDYLISNKVPPHTTIAANLSSQELETAVLIVNDNFKAFEGYITKLALIQNKPRTDIKVWNLKE
jgi:hypothetical protein